MKLYKKASLASIALTIFSLPILNNTEATITTPEVYVALGDSVAAGATPYDSLDAGYTDIIAQKLAQNGLLAGFSKDFAVPGFATTNVLDLLEQDEVRQGVEQATMITLSAGANNVLGLVQQDALGETVVYDQLTANFVLNQMRIQYGEILDEIKAINPTATVYAFGYYFPYPHVLDTQQQGVRKMLETVNTIIENEAISRDMSFVDVASDFNENGIDFLPNPTDVHPNQAGYVSIANSFFNVVDSRFDVTFDDIPPNPGMSPFLEDLMQSSGMSIDDNQMDVQPDSEVDEQGIDEITDDEEVEVDNVDGAAIGPMPTLSVQYHSPIFG